MFFSVCLTTISCRKSCYFDLQWPFLRELKQPRRQGQENVTGKRGFVLFETTLQFYPPRVKFDVQNNCRTSVECSTGLVKDAAEVALSNLS